MNAAITTDSFSAKWRVVFSQFVSLQSPELWRGHQLLYVGHPAPVQGAAGLASIPLLHISSAVQCWVYQVAAPPLPFKSVSTFTETQYKSQVHSNTSSLVAYTCHIPFHFIFSKALPAQKTAAIWNWKRCWDSSYDSVLQLMPIALTKIEWAEVG